MTDTKDICEAIKGLIELADQLPQYLRSDWQDTNHFELTDGSVDAKDYFWIDFSDMFVPSDNDDMWCDGETGKRLGLVMDCAAALSANAGNLKALVAENEALRDRVDRMAAALGKIRAMDFRDEYAEEAKWIADEALNPPTHGGNDD